MTTGTTNGSDLFSHDAGLAREALGRELAEWRMRGWFSGDRAARFRRAVRMQARRLGLSPRQIEADLSRDADHIIAEADDDA